MPGRPGAGHLPQRVLRSARVRRKQPRIGGVVRHEAAVAIENPHVIVARTFSKAYGMAGLRMGYAVGHPDTIKQMAEWDAGSGTSSLNVLAMRAGIAAIQQDAAFITAERARNTEVRDFTTKWFSDRGMKPTDSQ